ncbi:PREDICTED: putative F-box protein At5g60060 [Camelina sativa]|uniref:F-box protein At5g60060 n=1 Tax=Camelina sativa TaxID=90675 RepID=A0ABM0WXE5_CAMSA|nr:PREDICTED: putative F-box protein At5g60060 [Camelina sativa]
MESSSSLLPSQWSNLPLDILELISNCLDHDGSSDTVDLICLRSVCATWRLFLPLSDNKNSLSKFPKYLPFWSSSSSSTSGFFILKQSSVYKLEAPLMNSSTWLVKLQETTSPGKMRVLDLFSNDRISFLPEKFPENIDLQEFHVRLVRRAYRMEYANNGGGEMSSCFWSLNSEKVVILSSGEEGSATAIMAIHSGGKLGFLKSGNEERWRILDNSWNVIYEDIMMLHRENCCIVVDDKGKTVIYDVDFKVSDLGHLAEGLVGGGGHKKHLVEPPGGEVLLVDKYVKRVWSISEQSKSAVEFRVYKLNREEKRWEEVRELGDVALFIGDDCSYSVQIPARDFAGGCIFYKDYRNGGRSRGVCCDGDGLFNVDFEMQGNFVFPIKPNCFGP